MFEILAGFIATVATVGVGTLGYLQARRFVAKRLRYVDQAQNPGVPLVAGAVAFAVALPFAVLPFIGFGTALVFGIAVAAGTRSGVKSFGRALYP